MYNNFPATTEALLKWTWADMEPYYKDLQGRELTADNVNQWLKDWSTLSRNIYEIQFRLEVMTTIDTTDQEAENLYKDFFDHIFTNMQAAENTLKQKLLASRLEPKGFEISLRNMRAEADLFRDENLPLLADEQKILLEYDKIMGAQTVQWEGEEKTISQMYPIQLEKDRARREKAFRLVVERQFADFEQLGEVWAKVMPL